MPVQRILDSHVHLWPSSAANNEAHAWMHKGDHLAKPYTISDYLPSSSPSSDEVADYEVKGFVYVETDRRYRKELLPNEDVLDFKWARECYKENAFLMRIIKGVDDEGEGFDMESAKLMKGCVLWAPIDRGLDVFVRWLNLENSTGLKWVKGFRYLLQGIRDKVEFDRLVRDPGSVEVLKYMGKKGWSFDVGVDQRQGGSWQLEKIPGLIERVHEGVEDKEKTVFVLSTCILVVMIKISADEHRSYMQTRHGTVCRYPRNQSFFRTMESLYQTPCPLRQNIYEALGSLLRNSRSRSGSSMARIKTRGTHTTMAKACSFLFHTTKSNVRQRLARLQRSRTW